MSRAAGVSGLQRLDVTTVGGRRPGPQENAEIRSSGWRHAVGRALLGPVGSCRAGSGPGRVVLGSPRSRSAGPMSLMCPEVRANPPSGAGGGATVVP